jgi:hypothetical protein
MILMKLVLHAYGFSLLKCRNILIAAGASFTPTGTSTFDQATIKRHGSAYSMSAVETGAHKPGK